MELDANLIAHRAGGDEERGFFAKKLGGAFLQAVANVLAIGFSRLSLEEQMRQQALHDPLTGVANRTLCPDRILPALAVSAVGLGVAVLVQALWPGSAYVWFFGVALFGALFVWLMIFVTHIASRRPSIPLTSCVGAAAIAGILISTWWVQPLRSTLLAGGPWLLALAIGYRLSAARATEAID